MSSFGDYYPSVVGLASAVAYYLGGPGYACAVILGATVAPLLSEEDGVQNAIHTFKKDFGLQGRKITVEKV